MKCFIRYRRANAYTINGEKLIVSQQYSTFDKEEMDRLEDYVKSTIGCGVSIEYDIDKCIENEKEGNDAVLSKIRAEIKGWQIDIHDNENDADKHDFVFERIYEIIDEYK